MEDYSEIIRSAFEMGSIPDAQQLFEGILSNAFPTFHFRKAELLRFVRENEYMEGRSLNHVFQIHTTTFKGSKVWEVHCHRVTMGKTPDKQVYLDYTSLNFVRYKDQ